MAERLADIIAQIQNVRQLEAVVTAMRGIAASRAQQARSLLAGIKAYTEVISGAIGRALSLVPPDGAAPDQSRRGRRGLILFCAEQGFAGGFSERVLDAVMGDLAGGTVFLVGTRGIAVADERGVRPQWSAPMAAHAGAIPSFASRVADALYERVADGTVAQVDVVFSHSHFGGGIEIARHSLLPIDLGRFARPVENQPPLIALAPWVLLERFASEYVYAQLCEAATEAFAAENEARMMAMAAAKTNIESKLASFSQRAHQLRQEEITNEIVELAAVAAALPHD
ncbi:MAG TPA: F0F1 ATP synthase subunit gamma [Xanthobacteraceae bacterium]|jgi:F-type H+-transporting ATPase subunit gamma|nr:F0F1 ATP synthase subunit gamma [Xanthobacteraceae bacterium]